MWKFSNLNSDCTIWPPDAWLQHNPNSLVYPTNANPYGSFSGNVNVPLPGFRAQDSSLHFDLVSSSSLNLQALNRPNCPVQLGANAPHKRFLVFDQSVEQTSLLIGMVAHPLQVPDPNLPTKNAINVCASNAHGSEEVEEIHEDTEDIDALLYSESENSDDGEEASTGHSPLVMEEEEKASSHGHEKCCRLDLSEIDTYLIDTASSLRAPQPHCTLEYKFDRGSNMIDVSGGENMGYRIQMTMNMLRKIIPGCQGKDADAVLDEAIQYLYFLKLQAKEYW